MARFRSKHHLHRKSEFDSIYRHGRRFSDAYFVVLARPNSLPHARLGLSISSRAVGNAVNRNRVKRVVRESFRSYLTSLPTLDVVVSARESAAGAKNAVLVQSLGQLWDKLARHA